MTTDRSRWRELGRTERRRVIGPFIRSDRGTVWVLAVGSLDLGLEQLIVLPILPAIQRSEHASITAAAWLQTAFLLSAVATVPIIGRLGDMYGRRRLLLIAIAASAGGSLLCAVSTSIVGLIAGRAVQGASAGMGPLAIGIVRDRAPRGRASVWIGLLVSVAGVGAAVGLLAGGLLAQHVSIAAVFWVLFGVAGVLFIGVVLFMPETPRADSADRPDWIGGLLLAGALVSFLLAVSKGNTWGWGSAGVVILMVVAALALIGFAAYERSRAAPLIDMRLLAQRSASSAVLAAFGMGFALFIAGFVIPQIATLPTASGYGLGLSYAQAGAVLLPGALGIAAGGWTAGLFVSRLGARAVVACGALAAAAGYAILALAPTSVAVLVLGNVPVGIGIGLVIASIQNLIVWSVDETRTSAFSATATVTRSTGAALGTQIAAAIVISAGVTGSFPAESGFTDAFMFGLAATLVALGAAIAIPDRRTDPSWRARTPALERRTHGSPTRSRYGG